MGHMSLSPALSPTQFALSETDLTPEQNDAIDRLYEHDETLLIARVGFGKAVVSMTAADQLICDGVLRRVLVLAPLRVCELTWGPEREKWNHIGANVAIATGNQAQRSAAVNSGAEIVVTNFENVKWMLTHFAGSFDGLIIDEITKLKKAGGTAAKALRKWVKNLTWRVGMTGTPVAEAGEDIYMQALLLDLGKALGTKKDGFRQKYFEPADWNQYRWVPRSGAMVQIAERLGSLVFMADDSSYWDALPPVDDIEIEVELPIYVRGQYDQMEKHGVLETGSQLCTAVNQAVRQGKLHQIANGSVYNDEGQKMFESFTFKQEALEMILAEVKGPVVIVYQFAFELDWLRQRFPGCPILGEGRAVLPEEIDEWNRGTVPALIMHPKSAAHGLNLQYGSSTIVHLSPVWGADPWAQVLGRVRRRGTPADVITRYTLVAAGTVEESILLRMDEKAMNEEEMMEALGNE